MAFSSEASYKGACTFDKSRLNSGVLRFLTILLIICKASNSLLAKWSATPDYDVCTVAPPSYSAVTTSPVAAFTNGGPPKKIVPFPLTITLSSDIAGT